MKTKSLEFSTVSINGIRKGALANCEILDWAIFAFNHFTRDPKNYRYTDFQKEFLSSMSASDQHKIHSTYIKLMGGIERVGVISFQKQVNPSISRLTTAAPELLEACKAAAAQICNHESGHQMQFQLLEDLLKRVIQKATEDIAR